MVPEGMIDIPDVINLVLTSFQFSFVMTQYSRHQMCTLPITVNDVYSGKNSQAPEVRYSGRFR